MKEELIGKRRSKRSKLEKKESMIAFGFVSIKLVGFAAFTLIPVCICILYSFTNMNPLRYSETVFSYFGEESFWNGIQNYVNLFTHPLYTQIFLRSALNTIILLISVPLGMAAGLVLAVLLTDGEEDGYRALKTFAIPAHCGPDCRDVRIEGIRFVVPDSSGHCAGRRLYAQTMANYMDTDFDCE